MGLEIQVTFDCAGIQYAPLGFSAQVPALRGAGTAARIRHLGCVALDAWRCAARALQQPISGRRPRGRSAIFGRGFRRQERQECVHLDVRAALA